jgi:hypothetical protein
MTLLAYDQVNGVLIVAAIDSNQYIYMNRLVRNTFATERFAQRHRHHFRGALEEVCSMIPADERSL